MTTAREVQRLVAPLLSANPDVEWIGRSVVLKPVGHFARQILLDAASPKDVFAPRWAVIHLFQARRTFSLTWGEELAFPERGTWWNINWPDVQKSLLKSLETVVLPKLREIQTLEAYLDYVTTHYFKHHLLGFPRQRMIMNVALGNLAEARVIAADHGARWRAFNPQLDAMGRRDNYDACRMMDCLETDDRDAMVRLLHEWEAESVRNLKLENLWQPSPFPLEDTEKAGTYVLPPYP